MSDLSENRIGGASTSAPPYSSQQASSPGAADKLSDLKDKAAEDFAQIRDAARDHAQAAMDMTASQATEQKNFVARQLSGVAEALQKVGSELQRGDQQTLGKYTADLGGGAKRIAEDIRDRDLGEVTSMVEDFGRRQPVAFLGLAALAGFAASRFVTASAQRSSLKQARGQPDAEHRATMTSATGADYSNDQRDGGYNG
jgi:hypothetical protein